MRKKICIATPVDYGNFGNRLQNYAVHMICKKMGMEPVTLAVEYSFVCGKIPKHRILELIHTFHIGNLISKANRLKSINKSYASWLFTKETIKTVYVENQDELNRMLTQSAYFGIGGDQIFAPYWNEIVWFSMFPECDPNSKICFSPSFGTDGTLRRESNMLFYDYKKDDIKMILSNIKKACEAITYDRTILYRQCQEYLLRYRGE